MNGGARGADRSDTAPPLLNVNGIEVIYNSAIVPPDPASIRA